MKLKEVFKRVVFCSIIGALMLNLTGCGAASSNTSDNNNVTTLEKETVLKAVSIAFNDNSKKKTTFITDASSSLSLSIQAQSEEKGPNSWIIISSTDLGVEQKESFNLGVKDYKKTIDIGKNEISEEIATFNTWTYTIDAENVDQYQKNEFGLYTSEAHLLQNTVASDGGQSTTIAISRIDGTVVYISGIEFIITSGSVIISYQGASYTMSLSYPFILKYDVDNNGVNENYSGTFSATDLDSSGTTDYFSSTIADENGVIYGQVQIYNDGRAKVIPSE